MANKLMMHVLPVEAYTSQDWFDREQEIIFSKVWRFAGFASDISEPGQFVTAQAGLYNIFVVMGQDQRLRAFHNVCRHRGTQILTGMGKTGKALTCPYHEWTYNFEGDLVSVPAEMPEFEGLDKSCLGLRPASVGLWRGMLFVHPQPDAGSITEWFGEIETKLGPHKVDELVDDPEAATSSEIRANWKIVVENFLDIYHLAPLHTGSLAIHDQEHAKYGFVGPHYTFWEPLAPHYVEIIKQNTSMPLIIPEDQLGTSLPMLFPGLGLAETETSWSTFEVVPVAPDLTHVKTRTRVKNESGWKFTRQEWHSGAYWWQHLNGNNAQEYSPNGEDPLASADFLAKDVNVCEQQQNSLKSPYFEVGPLAEHREEPIRQHQRIVLDFLEGRR